MGPSLGNRTAAELTDHEDAQHGSRRPSSSDQVGQLQSKIDRAALHRDLIVGMEDQKKDPISCPILTTISVAIIPRYW